jgi:hypothetical protein
VVACFDDLARPSECRIELPRLNQDQMDPLERHIGLLSDDLREGGPDTGAQINLTGEDDDSAVLDNCQLGIERRRVQIIRVVVRRRAGRGWELLSQETKCWFR